MEPKELIKIATRVKHNWFPGDCDDAYRLALHVLATNKANCEKLQIAVKVLERLSKDGWPVGAEASHALKEINQHVQQ